MSSSHSRWLRLVSAILLLAFFIQAPRPASAGDSIPELLGPGVALDAATADPLALRARSASLNLGLLEPVRAALAEGGTPGPLALSLFDDTRLVAHFNRLDPTAGGYTLAGSLAGSPHAEIHLSLTGESLFASINTGSGLFRLSSTGGGVARVIQVDPSKLPQEAEPLSLPASSAVPVAVSAREAGIEPVYLVYDPDPIPVHVEPSVAFDTLGPQAATFAIDYIAAGGTNYYGYTCQAFPSAAQSAFTAAVNVWASLLTSPVTIRIEACWSDMDSGILGGSASLSFWRGFSRAPFTDTWYPVSQASALYGDDLRPASYCTGRGEPTSWCDDMTIIYNSDYASYFYYGTDGHPAYNQLDFMSLVLHEVGHGLGFAGGMRVSSGLGYYGVSSTCDYPHSYDHFTYGPANALLSGTYPCNSIALATALTSGNVTFRGENAVAANGGNVPLYAPLSWQQGSSYSHLSTSYDGTANALMTHSLGDGESIHDPGPVGLGLLRDTGWVPFRPTNFVATAASATQINLSWTDTNLNETGYKIERSPDGSTGWTTITTTAADATSYSNTGLSAGTPYYYRISAVHALGASLFATANATTPAGGLNPPGSLSATPVSNTQINLTWTDTNSDETGYQVERSPNGYDSWTTLATTAANATSYASTSLSSGTRYHYQVKAVKSGGSSAYVDTSAITFPLGPGATDDGSRIDVFVGYTTAARTAAGNTTAMLNLINTAVSETNTGYANSKVHQRVALVGTSEYDYSETAFNWNTTLERWTGTNDGYMDAAHTSRDNLKADEMVLVVADTGYCGIGWMMGSGDISPSNAPYGFVLVSIDCLTGYYSFSHEMGHNMGAHHDRTSVGGGAVTFPFGYGFWIYNPATSRYNWRTIMAYDTYSTYGYSAARVNYWSNPNVLYEGQPSGKPVTDSNSAYNALVLNNTAWAVGRYREGNPPTAPSGLAANRLSPSSVQLTWTDASSDETRFLIERASESVEDWAAIAAVPAGATTYTDNTAPSSVVRYRVLSDNGNGRSASNIVTTILPPNAPSGLTATAVGATRVDLAWNDNSSNETAFKVERSLDSGASWSPLVTLAANTTAYADTNAACNRENRYRVYATNTGGDSAKASASATTGLCVPVLSGSARRTSVTLLWADVYGESSYTVELWNGSAWAPLASGLPAGTTSYQHTGLTPNTTYQYQLKAIYTSPSGTTISNTVAIKTMLYECFLPGVRK